MTLATKKGRVTRADVAALLHVSPAQAYRLLNRLKDDQTQMQTKISLPLAREDMTDEEFSAMLERSLNDVKHGRTTPLHDAFNGM